MSAATTAETAAVATATSAVGMPGAHAAREFLTFRLGAEEYGIDILKVQEIRGMSGDSNAVTRIANAPAFIKGVINLRGVIVPIVDLRVKFNLGEAEYNAFTVVVILNVARRVVGVVVDSVSDVLELTGAQIKPAPQFNSLLDAGYITGLATLAAAHGSAESGRSQVGQSAANARTSTATATTACDRMLILMDIERLMSSADMALVEPAAD